MIFNPLPLSGAYLITLESFKDARGQFARIFCKEELKEIKFEEEIVQINHSINIQRGAIRGMHYQVPPKAETKFVKCIKGEVIDVIIDIRENSPTFLKWHAEKLSEDNMKVLYIPKGFAHGFQVLKANSELLYFHTEYYDPRFEAGIRFDDPIVSIDWPLKISEISERDAAHPHLNKDFAGLSS